MKIKKVKDIKTEVQDPVFNAKSLEKDKDEKPSFKTSTDDQEKVEKEFKKELNKIEKFESFAIIITNNDDDELEISDDFGRPTDEYEVDKQSSKELRGSDFLEDEIESEYQESETSGCGCCDDCKGEPGCNCGCEDCKCDQLEEYCDACDRVSSKCVCDEENVQRASDFVNAILSESLKYHLDNNKPITENIFRPGSEAFYEVIKEARQLFDAGKVNLCDIDKEIFESTEIGKFGFFNGKLVPLDLPMENIIELNEAEYKGKEVELNHPMRNTGSGKKYYVYVKNPKTKKIIRVNFGDVKGGLTAKVSDPEARKNFASRHKCSTKKDKTKAGYWACRLNKYGHLFGGKTYPGFW
jgi:hypothetical protein